jgi:hypothetical protein
VDADSVDLTARTSGLLPFWLFLLIVAVWAVAVVLRWKRDPANHAVIFPWLVAGSLVLANVLFFWRPLFTAAHLPKGGGDLNSFFFSLHAYSADRITSGDLPLWNPHLHGGMPQLGNFQAAVLYPPNLIAYLVAQPFTYSAIELLAILHYLIASIGAYLLLRSLGAGRIGSVAGGMLFAYGGFFVAHLGHFSMISAAAWVPWLLWSIHCLVESRSWPHAAVLAGIVFMTASGGHQQTLLFSLVGAGFWWLFLTLRSFDISVPGVGTADLRRHQGESLSAQLQARDVVSAIGQFAGAIATGLLLAAPMILPSLQLAQRSVRSTLGVEQAAEFSVQPVALLQLILPTVFGSNPTDYWGHFSSGEIWGYMGVTTLVVAGLGVALRPTAHRMFYLGLAVVSLLFALGPAAPIHGWFYQFVPGFDLVRAPARAYLFFNLAIAVLAGLAVSDLTGRIRNLDARTLRVASASIRVVLIVVASTALLIIPLFYTRILGVADPPNRPVIAVDNLWMLLLFLSALLGVLWLWKRGALRSAALGVTITVVMLLDLFSATMPFNPTEEDLVASYREPEISEFLAGVSESDEPFRIENQHPELLPNFPMLDGFQMVSGVYDPMQPSAYTQLHHVVSEDPGEEIFNLLNVRFLLLPSDSDPPDGFDLVLESSSGNQIWERSNALPRAWFAAEAIDVDYSEQLDVIRAGAFDPRTQVLIDGVSSNGDDGSTGDVSIMRYSPEAIELQVDSDVPGYVVLSEGDFPGWVAKVNGEPTEILTANFGLRAVEVDSGSSEIELRYEPGLVRLGWLGAVLGLIAITGMVLRPVVRARMRRTPDENVSAS